MPNTDFGPLAVIADIRANFNSTLTDQGVIVRTTREETEWGAKDVTSDYLTISLRWREATPFEEQSYASQFKGKSGYVLALPINKPSELDPDDYGDYTELLDLLLTDAIRITTTATGETFLVEVTSKEYLGGSFAYGLNVKAVRA